MNAPWDDLAASHEAVWQRLARALADRKAAFRTPVLATVGTAGGAEARTVVLRGVDRDAAHVEVYTDRRTPKVAELAAQPRATLLFWDARARLQVRLRVDGMVLDDDLAASRWDALPSVARRDYAALATPSAYLAGDDLRTAEPDARHFAVLRFTVHEIETLHLGADAHRRALFRRADGWTGQWLQP